MAEKYVIAHDLGTSGNKATLFSLDGRLIRSSLAAYETHYYNANWAEQDPRDWWKAVCTSTRELMQGIDKNQVVALSFSAHMMACLCVDKSGRPLRPCIIWADMRATEQADALSRRIDPHRFYGITGHRISSSYTLEKLMWVQKNEPDVYKATYKTLNPKDYIAFCLTGAPMVTDYSDASGTNAFDLNTFCWSEEILQAAGIDMEKFPDAKPSTYVVGEVSRQAAEACGLAPGTKVVIGAGDGSSAYVGAGAVSLGKSYCSLGTSAWVATTTDHILRDEGMRLTNWAHVVPGLIGSLGPMQAAGASLSWLKNTLCLREQDEARARGISPYDVINEKIASAPPGSNGLLYLPYLVGERAPRWNPNARGVFLGLKMEHRREDILRSVVEGVGYNLKIILDLLRAGAPVESLTLVGGMARGEIEREIFCDIFGLPVHTLNHLEEATSMGAAVCAGVGVGELEDFSQVDRFIAVKETRYPHAQNTARYERMSEIFDKAYTSLLDVYEEMAKL